VGSNDSPCERQIHRQASRRSAIPCPACGGWIDCRDLGQVFEHNGPLPHGLSTAATGVVACSAVYWVSCSSSKAMYVVFFRFDILRKRQMARPSNLSSMSIEALIKLRDDIGSALSRKAGQLQSELAALGDGGWLTAGKKAVGRPRGSKIKGRKVAPKYRNPKNRVETWAGRGAMPRWMTAQIKAGKKREDFAIDKSLAKTKKASVKRTRRKSKSATAPRKAGSKPGPASSSSEASA
jgi:DNA-binding protein H-NS